MPTTRVSMPRANFTKDQIREVMNLWETKSTDEIAEKLGLNKGAISYLANVIRKEGYRLPKKHKIGILRALVKDVIQETRSA